MITRLFIWVERRCDEGGWIRRGYLAVSMAMTCQFVIWGQQFAGDSPRDGADISMILGALGVPLSAMTGFAFREYLESRRPPVGDFSFTQEKNVR